MVLLQISSYCISYKQGNYVCILCLNNRNPFSIVRYEWFFYTSLIMIWAINFIKKTSKINFLIQQKRARAPVTIVTSIAPIIITNVLSIIIYIIVHSWNFLRRSILWFPRLIPSAFTLTIRRWIFESYCLFLSGWFSIHFIYDDIVIIQKIIYRVSQFNLYYTNWSTHWSLDRSLSIICLLIFIIIIIELLYIYIILQYQYYVIVFDHLFNSDILHMLYIDALYLYIVFLAWHY